MLTWFITGSSRGFGLELARQALGRGDAVVATARDPRRAEDALDGPHERLLATALDVTDEAQIAAAVTEAIERFGRIDVLVNNAGRGLLGALEETSAPQVRDLFDLNVFGLLAVTRAVLPVMRRQRSGRVLNISSVGGFTGRAGSGIYSATKFAVEGLSESLRAELAPLGIGVVIIEPGAFRTDFLDARSILHAEGKIEDYSSITGEMLAWAAGANHSQPGDPAKAAAAMIAVATAAEPPERLALGSDCVGRVEAKLQAVAGDLAAWRELALSTDHRD
ncbi:MAG TPA: oxidoreductase [Acidimicrobiales bacterium]|nr:oxidoreductase [Acidimicrobiales bacterium]